MKELKLSEIWIYPVKSLGGIKVQSSRVMEKGLRYDRRWMLVDEEGKFMTQRGFPKMALFKLSMKDDQLQITYRDFVLTLPNAFDNEPQQTTIWHDTVTTYEVNKEHSQWFSDTLATKCKLVYFPEDNPRPIDAAYSINNEHVSLADAYPFLIIGQSTLDNLNSKLSEPVPMNRFRPNFVFTGGEPHEEDHWRNFSIGINSFVGVKPCARCMLPTVNQDTGEKGTEPMKTLTTYRSKNNKVLFGQNLIALDHKEIKTGDMITVTSYR